MPMTPDQQNELINKISTKWKHRNCPMCGPTSWTISDSIFELREFHGRNFALKKDWLLLKMKIVTKTQTYVRILTVTK